MIVRTWHGYVPLVHAEGFVLHFAGEEHQIAVTYPDNEQYG